MGEVIKMIHSPCVELKLGVYGCFRLGGKCVQVAATCLADHIVCVCTCLYVCCGGGKLSPPGECK